MGNLPGGNYGAGRGPAFGPQGFGPQPPNYQGYPGTPPTAQVSPPPYGHHGMDYTTTSPGFQRPGSPQGYPPQEYPPHGYPPHGYPPHGYPPQGYPPQGYPPQGYPPQGFPPQGFPGHGPAPSPGIGDAACCAGCMACLAMLLCSCCNGLMDGSIPPDGAAPSERTPVAPPSTQVDHDVE